MTNKEKMISLLETAYKQGYNEGAESVTQHDEKQELPYLVINLEPLPVSEFMAEEYPDSIVKTGVSLVDKYITSNVIESYRPSWTEITNPLTLGSMGDTVRLTLNSKTTEYPGGSRIFNLIPQCEYGCEVVRDGKVIYKCIVKTEGRMRFLNLDDPTAAIVNARDAGGFKCSGGRLAYNKWFRSAILPEKLNADSGVTKTLLELGVTDEIDFHCQYKHTDCGWNYHEESFPSYENAFKNPTQVRKILDKVVSIAERGGIALVHCQAGADRTGTFNAMVMLLLGCSLSDTIHAYELPSTSCWCNFIRINKNGLRKFLQALAKFKGDTYQDKMMWWFVNKAGYTVDEVAHIRKVLVCEDA